ncbi:sporulation protein YjcZ [Aneurinibacillus soli]|nr:sporulation protein YjcZ [Aneurinibacillus soli]
MKKGGDCMGFFNGNDELGVILVLFILLVIIACACD